MSSSMRVVGVTGATGRQGGSVLRALLAANEEHETPLYHIRAFTRNLLSEKALKLKALSPECIELVQCDLLDSEGLTNAFTGCEWIFGVTNFWESIIQSQPEVEVVMGENIVAACVYRKVKHLVWSTLPDSRVISAGAVDIPLMTNKARVEEYARTKAAKFPNLTVSFICPGLFISTLLDELIPGESAGGKYLFPFPFTLDRKLPYVDPEDIGRIVLRMWTDPVTFSGKTVKIATQFIAPQQIIGLMNIYGQPSKAIFMEPAIVAAHVGPVQGALAEFFNTYGGAVGDPADDDSVLQQHAAMHGCPMKRIEAWLKENVEKGTFKTKGRAFGIQIELGSMFAPASSTKPAAGNS